MNPAELKGLANLYKERNELDEHQKQRVDELKIRADIQESAERYKKSFEAEMMNSVRAGEQSLTLYDYYLVSAFLETDSMEGLLEIAEKYQKDALKPIDMCTERIGSYTVDNRKFNIKTSAQLLALYEIMKEGLYVHPVEREPKGPQTHNLVIDWSNVREDAEQHSANFTKEAEFLRSLVRDMRNVEKMQERVMRMEEENRTLRKITGREPSIERTVDKNEDMVKTLVSELSATAKKFHENGLQSQVIRQAFQFVAGCQAKKKDDMPR